MANFEAAIRVEIGGRWLAQEFAFELQILSHLHDVFQVLDEAEFKTGEDISGKYRKDLFLALVGYPLPPREGIAGKGEPFLFPVVPLQVAAIRYESPGFQDFFGVAKSLKEVFRFVETLVHLGRDLERKDLQNEKLRQEIAEKKLKNVERVIKVCRQIKMSDDEIREVVGGLNSQKDFLLHLTASQKIAGISARIEE
jgi:hypothetical protein